MSQLSELLEKNKPAYMSARLEATVIILNELINILSPEQREKLNSAIITRCPSIKNASASDPCTVDYQLSLFIQKVINSDD